MERELPAEPGRHDRVAVLDEPLVAADTPGADANIANDEAVERQGRDPGRARTCAELRGRMPTIIAVDQFAIGGLFAAVRELNGVRR